MKKILLTLLTVLVAASSFAQNLGDYIYTSDARFKVIGENLLPKLSSWDGRDVDVFSEYQEDDAPSANAMMSLTGAEGVSPLCTTLQMETGKSYIITMKIKGAETTVSTNTEGGANQIDAWITSEDAQGSKVGTAGTDYIQVSGSNAIIGGEWTTISFAWTDTCSMVNETEAHTLNIKISRITTNTVIADVQAIEVTPVYDTRIAQRQVDFAKKLLADPNLNGQGGGDLAEMVEVAQEYIDTEAGESTEEMAGVLGTLAEAQASYLALTATDISSSFNNINITSLNKVNNGDGGGKINAGCFTTEGGDARWGHPSNSEWIDYSFPGSYALRWGAISLRPNGVTLPAGKYLFMCDLFATQYLQSKVNGGYYGEDLSVICDGAKIFIGTDTIEVGPIANRQAEALKYYMIGEVKEGEEFFCGAWFPGFDPYGGTFRIAHTAVYSLGDISANIERQHSFTAFKSQYDAAVSALNNVKNSIDNANFPWNQAELKEALATWEPNITEVTPWIADGKDTGVATKEQLDEWPLAQGVADREQDYPVVRGLQAAYNAAAAANKPYSDLLALVKEAKESIASGEYKADPKKVNATISDAEAMIKAITTEAETEAFQDMVNSLQADLTAYYSASATYKAPALITIIDPDFKAKSGNAGKGTSGLQYWNGSEENPTGWIYYTTNGDEYFRIENAAEFQVGRRASMWRGWTGNPRGHLYQDVLVENPGHYQLVCQAYATGDNIKVNNGIRTINVQTETQIGWDEDLEEEIEIQVEISRDTVYHSGIYLELCDAALEQVNLGENANSPILANHLEIYTSKEVAGNYNPEWFTLSYDVKEPNTTLRFGINGLNTGYNPDTDASADYGPNAYGIGSVYLYYYGPSDDYYKDEAANGGEYNPQTVAVEKVQIAKPTAGVYSLTGQKVGNSLQNLPKGIYIMGGKKYMVK